MPSTVRTARAPTDLKPNLIRVKKRDDERAHRREGGEGVKEFQHLGTSDRVVGRPRTGYVARIFYCECMYQRPVNAILTNICSIVTHTAPRPAEPGRIVRVCPTCLRFQNVPNRRGDSEYNSHRKRRTPRKCTRARAAWFSAFVKCPGSDPRAFLFALVAAQMPSTVRTARAPTDLKPNLIRVKKRDDERARIGRWRLAALSKKNGADSSAESAPKKEWQSKNVDGREKCPQVSWPSHPTCQRDG